MPNLHYERDGFALAGVTVCPQARVSPTRRDLSEDRATGPRGDFTRHWIAMPLLLQLWRVILVHNFSCCNRWLRNGRRHRWNCPVPLRAAKPCRFALPHTWRIRRQYPSLQFRLCSGSKNDLREEAEPRTSFQHCCCGLQTKKNPRKRPQREERLAPSLREVILLKSCVFCSSE